MSLSLRRKETKQITGRIAEIAAAICLALTFTGVISSQLGLPYGLRNAFQGGLVSGMVSAWNQAADTMGNTNYVLLQKYDGGGGECGLFLSLFTVILFVAALLLIKSKFYPVLLLFVVPQVLLSVCYGLYPDEKSLVFFIIALLFGVMVMKSEDLFFPALITAVVLALIAVIAFAVVGQEKPLSKVELQAGKSLVESAGNLLYGSDDLGHGDAASRKRQIREGEALSVTMDVPRSVYLKGFTGAEFDGKKWRDLANSTYYRVYDMMSNLEEDGFFAVGQPAQAALLSGQMDGDAVYETVIRNTGADKRCVYVPYDMTGKGSLADVPLKGGSIFSPGIGGIGEYRFLTGENQVNHWTDLTAGFFETALNAEEENPAVEDYLRQESHANVFVYDYYTQISKTERKLLEENFGNPGDQSDGHINYKYAIREIRSFLEENFIYSEDLGEPLHAKGDQLEEFFDSHKGFDVQYATAATLLFRYYGIPARYAEGYLITPEDAQTAEPKVAFSISRHRAHAWTEIYIDGIGFVPLEVTPEFYGIMEEPDLEAGISNEVLEEEFHKRYGNKTSSSVMPDTEEDTAEDDLENLKILWIIIGIILAVILLVLFVMNIITGWSLFKAYRKRRRLFYKSDAKTAVSAIYSYMENCGYQLNEEVMALGNLAAYSPYAVSEKDRAYMLGTLKEMQKAARAEKNE